jgi:hypothetical protein
MVVLGEITKTTMMKTNFPSEESYDYLFHVLLKELISRIDNLALKTVRKDLLDSADLKSRCIT